MKLTFDIHGSGDGKFVTVQGFIGCDCGKVYRAHLLKCPFCACTNEDNPDANLEECFHMMTRKELTKACQFLAEHNMEGYYPEIIRLFNEAK